MLFIYLKQSLFEYRKVIGFSLSMLHDCLANSHHFFIQSEIKPKLFVTLTRFPALGFDWFTVLYASVVIG